MGEGASHSLEQLNPGTRILLCVFFDFLEVIEAVEVGDIEGEVRVDMLERWGIKVAVIE